MPRLNGALQSGVKHLRQPHGDRPEREPLGCKPLRLFNGPTVRAIVANQEFRRFYKLSRVATLAAKARESDPFNGAVSPDARNPAQEGVPGDLARNGASVELKHEAVLAEQL